MRNQSKFSKYPANTFFSRLAIGFFFFRQGLSEATPHGTLTYSMHLFFSHWSMPQGQHLPVKLCCCKKRLTTQLQFCCCPLRSSFSDNMNRYLLSSMSMYTKKPHSLQIKQHQSMQNKAAYHIS